MALSGNDLSLTDIFSVGIPFEGDVDVAYFCNQPNASTARSALKFLSDQNNEIQLRGRASHADIVRMWKATFRACIAHGIEIPKGLKGYAKRLGVIVG